MTQGRENSDLTIIGFSKLSAPLASDTYRHFSFFWNAGFVYVQSTVLETTEQLARILSDFICNRLPVPVRIGKKILQRIVLGSGSFFFHTFHILLTGLKQAFEVLESLVEYIDCMPLKKLTIILNEKQKLTGKARQLLIVSLYTI